VNKVDGSTNDFAYGEENESRTESLKDGETRATKSVNKVDGSINDVAYGEENESRTESLKDGETRATKSVNKVDGSTKRCCIRRGK
jgi:hypothetical protein